MFLAKLSRTQQSAFGFLAKSVIMADEVRTKAEEALFEKIKIEMNNDDFPNELSESEILRIFDNPQAKKIVLFELYGIALCDGEFHEKEQELIENLAEQFKISKLEQAALCDLVLRLFKIYAETNDFIFSNNER